MAQRRIYVCALLILVTLVGANAQSPVIGTKVYGQVARKKDGAVIVNAKVTFENQSYKADVRTNSDGEYEIRLAPGVYEVTVKELAFKKFRLKKFIVSDKDVLLNILLKYGDPIVVDELHP